MTPNQVKLLRYIKKYIADNEWSPSYEEMQKHMNIKSKSGIHALIKALVERGKVKNLKYKKRSVEIIHG